MVISVNFYFIDTLSTCIMCCKLFSFSFFILSIHSELLHLFLSFTPYLFIIFFIFIDKSAVTVSYILSYQSLYHQTVSAFVGRGRRVRIKQSNNLSNLYSRSTVHIYLYLVFLVT